MIPTVPKKQFGQHFLRDASVIDRILRAVDPQPSDCFIEIGPGQGALTLALLSAPVASLDAIEIEHDVFIELQKRCGKFDALRLHRANAMEFDFSVLASSQEKWRLIGNLPYNIGSPLLFHCLAFRHLFCDIHFMLQKEVVDRVVASPGSKTYGRLSVMVQYHCEVERLFDVLPSAFWPPPQVMSTVFRLIPREHSVDSVMANDEVRFAALVKQAFSQRRKMISNSLASFVTPDALRRAGIDPKQRPEQLSVDKFAIISNIE